MKQLGHDLVLLRELGFELGDLAILAVLAWRPFGGRVKRRRAVLKEQLLPAVKLSRQNLVLVAQIRDRDFVDQMSFDDRNFVRRGKLTSWFLHHASFLA